MYKYLYMGTMCFAMDFMDSGMLDDAVMQTGLNYGKCKINAEEKAVRGGISGTWRCGCCVAGSI